MAQVGSGDYPSLHSASGDGTMASGELSTAAGVGGVPDFLGRSRKLVREAQVLANSTERQK